MNDMEERTYFVTGMTCGHCVKSVTEEVSEVAGVESVHVDLESRHVVVTGSDLDDNAVRNPVVTAGYKVDDNAS